MAEETTVNTTAAEPQAQTAATNTEPQQNADATKDAEKTFTQTEVNSLIQSRLGRGRCTKKEQYRKTILL